MQTYPTLNFIKKHGKPLAVAIAALIGLVTAALGFSSLSFFAVPVAVAVSVFILALGFSYVELVRLIMSMLVPE